jgi:hypothetical protein
MVESESTHVALRLFHASILRRGAEPVSKLWPVVANRAKPPVWACQPRTMTTQKGGSSTSSWHRRPVRSQAIRVAPLPPTYRVIWQAGPIGRSCRRARRTLCMCGFDCNFARGMSIFRIFPSLEASTMVSPHRRHQSFHDDGRLTVMNVSTNMETSLAAFRKGLGASACDVASVIEPTRGRATNRVQNATDQIDRTGKERHFLGRVVNNRLLRIGAPR